MYVSLVGKEKWNRFEFISKIQLMAAEKDGGEPKIRTQEIPGARDYWKRWRRGKSVRGCCNPQDLSVNEMSPLGPDGKPVELSKTSPSKMGGVTRQQMEESRKGAGWVAGIERSLSKGDKD